MQGISRHIADILRTLHEIDRAMRPEDPEKIPEEREYARLLDRRERTVRLLAMEPNFTEADVQAKIGVLCDRLRLEVQEGRSSDLSTYLLLESSRTSMPNKIQEKELAH